MIELLVVIAIIAILAAMLLPALNKSRQQARQIICLSNLKQVGISANLYLGDNESYFVNTWHKTNWNDGWHAWGWQLFENGYFGNERNPNGVYYCPLADGGTKDWQIKNTTYGVNQNATINDANSSAYKHVKIGNDEWYQRTDFRQIQQPDQYLFIMDTKTSAPQARNKGMIANVDVGWNGRIWLNHKSTGANALYGDGHASFTGVNDFVTLFGSGLGFAVTPLETW